MWPLVAPSREHLTDYLIKSDTRYAAGLATLPPIILSLDIDTLHQHSVMFQGWAMPKQRPKEHEKTTEQSEDMMRLIPDSVVVNERDQSTI